MATPEPSRQVAARIYAVYQKKLEAAGALDFGDLLLKTCVLLRDRPDIREYYQEYFNARPGWTSTRTPTTRSTRSPRLGRQAPQRLRRGRRRSVGVLLAWGQRPQYLEFERDFADTKVVKLEQNYRSTSSIIAAATAVIRNNKGRKAKTLWTQKEAGESVRISGAAQRDGGGALGRLMHRGPCLSRRRLSDMAVFYRTNAQSRSFEEALRRSGIPYKIVGAMRFYERKEIKDALALRAALAQPGRRDRACPGAQRPRRAGSARTSQEALAQFAREGT